MTAAYDKPEFRDWTTLIPEQKTVMDDASPGHQRMDRRPGSRRRAVARVSIYDKSGNPCSAREPAARAAAAHAPARRTTVTPTGSTRRSRRNTGAVPRSVRPSSGMASRLEARVGGRDPPLDASQIVAEPHPTCPPSDGARIPAFTSHRKDPAPQTAPIRRFSTAAADSISALRRSHTRQPVSFVQPRRRVRRRWDSRRRADTQAETWHRQGMLSPKRGRRSTT